MKPKGNLVWLDLEMTGLDPKTCTILEIGVIVTDSELNVLAESEPISIHHSDKVLGSMEAWSKQHHKASGLTQECRKSKISLKKAEKIMLEFIKGFCAERTAPLCGNTIGQDRRFLVKYMPKLEAYLHYRSIDVSSVKELVERWYPKEFHMPKNSSRRHRVIHDIRKSVEELKYYRDKVFISRS